MVSWAKHAWTSIPACAIILVLIALLDKPEFGPLDMIALFSFSLPDLDQRSMLWDNKPRQSLHGIEQELNHRRKEPIHRHFFWHSCAIPITAFLLGLYKGNIAGIGVLAVAIGTHLLMDYKPGRRGKTGTYTIYMYKGKRLSGKGTDRYLLLNGAFCYVVAVLTLVV